jgi:hypothetical protein
MPVSWIEHSGKRILYADYRNQSGKELLQTLDAELAEMRRAGKGVLLLADFRGASANDEFMSKGKAYGKELRDLTHKSAAIGISGMKKILLSAYNTFTGDKLKPLDSEDEAKGYLVS